MSMGKGRERPTLGDIDLSDMPGSMIQTDSAEVERRRAFASSLETPAFVARSADRGVVKVVRPPSRASSISTPPSASASQREVQTDIAIETPNQPSRLVRKLRSEEPNLTVRLPEYVQQAVRMCAVAEKTTVRLIILRALKGAGFEVREEDMTDDRGIVAKLRSRERV